MYDENISIDLNSGGEALEGLKLESTAGRYATIIAAASPIASVIAIHQPRVQIGKKGKGFTVEGATSDFGIYISTTDASRCKIEGNRAMGNNYGFFLRGERIQVRYNIAKDNSGTGIYCFSCARALFRENQAIGNGDGGIHVNSSDRSTVERNMATGNAASGIVTLPSSKFGKVRDNVSELSESEEGFFVWNAEGALIKGNISARNGDGINDNGFTVTQQDFTKSPSINNNLAVGNLYMGIYIVDLFNAGLTGNTIVQNTGGGLWIPAGNTVSTLKANNTYSSGTGCGLNNSIPVTYSKHFFGGGDVGCGQPSNGTLAKRPSPLKVRNAAKL